MILNQFPDRIINTGGIDYLYFGGTNYLGITTHPDFQNILFESIKKWGISYGSSRNSNIKLSVYESAENLLANNLKTEAVVTVSSGILAGKMVTELLFKSGYDLFHFPNTHTALIHPLSIPLFEKGNLNSKLLNNCNSKIAIFADGIPSLEVTPIDLSILDMIPTEKEITLILDESHSIGIVGAQGEGILSAIRNKSIQRKIGIASLGKAYGLSGGVIMGDLNFIAQIKNQNDFISASGMNPAYLETYVNAEPLYILQQQKLQLNLNFFSTLFTPNKNFTYNPKYPVIYFENESILDLLIRNKIIPTSFAYPTTSGKLNRLVITANHTLADLKKLSALLNSISS